MERKSRGEVYGRVEDTYTGNVNYLIQKLRRIFVIWVVLTGVVASAQEPAKAPARASDKSASAASQNDKQTAKEEKEKLPFQIALLETRVRFEANGDSRKEVHTVVKINDAGGAREFARLGFDYNRAFQSVELPLVKITHANGGTSEILPSAIVDIPNPAVEKFPAYQDVRVKAVRILGLQEGDTLEYRVITTTKPPLAPDFWLEHTFDRSGQVEEEKYQLEVPRSREIQFRFRVQPIKDSSENSSIQTYRWDVGKETWAAAKEKGEPGEGEPDVQLTTFASWKDLSSRLWESMRMAFGTDVWAEAMREAGAKTEPVPPKALYDLVVTKMNTVDLPVDFARYGFRDAREILKSGYASPQDKAKLLGIELGQERQLLEQKPKVEVLLSGTVEFPEKRLPSPSVFSTVLLSYNDGKTAYYLNPGVSVAPFGMVQAAYRGKPALRLGLKNDSPEDCWTRVSVGLPFPSLQRVNVEGTISSAGELKAKVKYVMRGDNELLLREAFHQTAKEKWNEVAGLLALSDGFRGHIEGVKASDPLETEKPFEVEYQIAQPKFVDWSKRPVRIPALLPQIALPDGPGKAGGKIELGTPLDVETEMTLQLPEGTTVQTPPATSVERDYAAYISKYDGHLNTVTASRHVKFAMREIPGERAPDYNAFVRAVKLDETQAISLSPGGQEEKRK